MFSAVENIGRWLWNNKEWLFSGIGVVILVWVLNALFRKRTPRAENSPLNQGNTPSLTKPVGSPVFSEPEYATHPTPVEIGSQLGALPLFQRSAAKESYVGLKVRWQIELVNLMELGNAERKAFQTDATHTLQAHSQGHSETTVWSNVNVNDFPRLKISHAGTPLTIFGTIHKITDSGHVRLKDSFIVFSDARHNGQADYRIGRDGMTLTFASERAIKRVSGPKPQQGWHLVFRSRQEAAQFVEVGESEGYSFEGKEFI